MTARSLSADGFTAALIAADSIKDAAVILHGPGGCRNYHSSLSQFCVPRSPLNGLIDHSGPFFHNQHRLPCTYLDETDYIFGASKKLEDSLKEVISKDYALTVVMKSPAASLIGDDVDDIISSLGLSDRALSIEASLISEPFSSSYDQTLAEIIDWFDMEAGETMKGTVNILGLPVSIRGWDHSLDETVDLLGRMGLKVISAPGSGTCAEDLIRSVKAEFNIVVCPEYGSELASLYEKKYGIRSISIDSSPVGFDATGDFYDAIAKTTCTDSTPVHDAVKRQKIRAFQIIKSSNINGSKAKLARFAVKADRSIAYPLTKWLYEYLSMIPAAVQVESGPNGICDGFDDWMEEIGFSDAMNRDVCDARSEILFSDGDTADSMYHSGRVRAAFGISVPLPSASDIIPRPVLGIGGSMTILDWIFNDL